MGSDLRLVTNELLLGSSLGLPVLARPHETLFITALVFSTTWGCSQRFCSRLDDWPRSQVMECCPLLSWVVLAVIQITTAVEEVYSPHRTLHQPDWWSQTHWEGRKSTLEEAQLNETLPVDYLVKNLKYQLQMFTRYLFVLVFNVDKYIWLTIKIWYEWVKTATRDIEYFDLLTFKLLTSSSTGLLFVNVSCSSRVRD